MSEPLPKPETSSLTVRNCTEGDLPAIVAIYADAVVNGTASFELAPPDLAEMRLRRANVLKGGYPYLVAERAGVVLGYAYAGAYRLRPAYSATVENSIYVSPLAQGQGVGRALMAQLIAQTESLGFRQMIAVIGDSQNMASQRLHGALGFAPVGVLKSVGWKHGRWLDCVLMQRALGAGDAEPG